jgi:hypothetical protein
VAGPVSPHLFVSTADTGSDWAATLIDGRFLTDNDL